MLTVLIGAGLVTAGVSQAIIYPIALGLSMVVPPILLWRLSFREFSFENPSNAAHPVAGGVAYHSAPSGHSVFISYSRFDREFARRLCADLRANHIRCWSASEEAISRKETRERLQEAIRLHSTVLLVVSAKTITSDWFNEEMTAVLEEDAFLPICLDDSLMQCTERWAARVRNRQIIDFTNWRNPDAYQPGLKLLLQQLENESRLLRSRRQEV